MSEEVTRGLPQDGVERILARLDSLDARLTAFEEKVDSRFSDVENRLSALEEKIDLW